MQPVALRAPIAIKLGWGPIGESRSLDLALIAAARDAAGSEMALMLDAGYGYGRDVAEATFIASALAGQLPGFC